MFQSLSQAFGNFFQPGNMVFRFTEMLLKGGFQFLRLRRIHHLGQSLRQLLLGAVEVSQLAQKQGMQVVVQGSGLIFGLVGFA